MIVGFALNVALWQQPHAIVLSNGLTLPKVAFTWYVLIGSVVTFRRRFTRASSSDPANRACRNLPCRCCSLLSMLAPSLLQAQSKNPDAASRPATTAPDPFNH